jgi:hypothetical protein
MDEARQTPINHQRAGRGADGQRLPQHAPTPADALFDAYAQVVISAAEAARHVSNGRRNA